MRRRADFTHTVSVGRRAGRRLLVVHLATVGDAAPGGAGGETMAKARVGFVVGRSVGGAVVRNRVRRRLQALVAARLDLLPSGSQVVVRANPASADASSAELRADLDSALNRLVPVVAATPGATG